MPGAVPRTSTFALTNATLSYGLDIADKGVAKAIEDDPELKKGVNIIDKKLSCRAVAEAFGMDCIEI
jgi:alanine dehydrogenase